MASLPEGSFSFSDIPGFVKVGKLTSIAEGVKFHSINREHQCSVNKKCVFTINWNQPGGEEEIVIGDNTWIGEGVRILPNIKIGNNCIIGAGSVVRIDIPDYAVVFGNPAIITGYRFTKKQREALDKMNWLAWPNELIEARKEDMEDIEIFLTKHGGA